VAPPAIEERLVAADLRADLAALLRQALRIVIAQLVAERGDVGQDPDARSPARFDRGRVELDLARLLEPTDQPPLLAHARELELVRVAPDNQSLLQRIEL